MAQVYVLLWHSHYLTLKIVTAVFCRTLRNLQQLMWLNPQSQIYSLEQVSSRYVVLCVKKGRQSETEGSGKEMSWQ
jgi:hypothetical protein